MLKRTIFAVVVVFIAWSILDFIIHGMLLKSTYAATTSLWRPMGEMNMPLMYLVTLAFTGCFVLIYAYLGGHKSLVSGIKFGVFFGLATGISMASAPTVLCPFL